MPCFAGQRGVMFVLLSRGKRIVSGQASRHERFASAPCQGSVEGSPGKKAFLRLAQRNGLAHVSGVPSPLSTGLGIPVSIGRREVHKWLKSCAPT